jgi:predicted short-subunit dehydrogenase-like oxidoreductase (DUF2520 family)
MPEGFFLRRGRVPMPVQFNQRDSVAILGLGKVGTAVGYLLRSAGYNIVAVAGRSIEKIHQGMTYTGGELFTDFAAAASTADCILITTSDDAIASVCHEICQRGVIQPGKKVIHMSGAGGLDLLSPAAKAGAFIASIHPLQSFASVEGAIKSIPGSSFGITADKEIRDWSAQLVRDLGGTPFTLADEAKPLYHAAACLASNYLTTLIHTVETLYQSLGFAPDEALRAFWPLVRGTLQNIEDKGTVQALTGPIARGDASTVAKHIEALRESFPALLPLYCTLGNETISLGLKKKTLDPDAAEILKKLLELKGEAEHDGTKNYHSGNS